MPVEVSENPLPQPEYRRSPVNVEARLGEVKTGGDSGIGTPEEKESDLPSTQSPWTYGYPMNSPLLKSASNTANGNDPQFVFDFTNMIGDGEGKEPEHLVPFTASSVATSVSDTVSSSIASMLDALAISDTPTTTVSDDIQRSLFTSVSSVSSDGEQDAFETASSDSSDASLGDLLGDKRWNMQSSGLQGLGQISSGLPPSRSYSVDLTPSTPAFMPRPLQHRVSISGPVSHPEVICTWSGHLPPKRHKNPTYSPRIFLGGVPWDITEASLIAGFRPFGGLSVDWPGKEGKHNRHPPKGYVYVTFESEKSVKALLTMCRFDPSEGGQWYYQVSSKRMRNKEVQVIPWALSDSNSIRCPSPRLDPQRTVFVGGLHGLFNAG